jgi:hypothetical protein
MPTYPNEIYVRPIDDAGNPMLTTFVKAKFLVDSNGNYVNNPDTTVSGKFNIESVYIKIHISLRESLFLRKIVLGIPAQAIGKNLTRLIIAFGTPAVLLLSLHTQQGVCNIATQ